MNFSTRQMENRRKANRSYRERRQAQGWKMVQFYLPPDLAVEVRQSIKTRFARYRAKQERTLKPLREFQPLFTRSVQRQQKQGIDSPVRWRLAKGRQEGTPAATR